MKSWFVQQDNVQMFVAGLTLMSEERLVVMLRTAPEVPIL